MYDFFVDHRSALGMRIYPAAPGVSRKLIEEVEAGAVLAILADRDLKGTGPEVVFFGEKTTFAAGPASIALETGIPPMVAGVFNEEYEDGKRGWRAVITEPIELPEGAGKEAIPALTQRIADEIEKLVARRPEDWHVFQPFWKSDREQADRQRKVAEGD
jgi:KDO2-lipid IV(A) lauroyltransferase